MKEGFLIGCFVGFVIGFCITAILASTSTAIPNEYLNNPKYRVDTLYINSTGIVYKYKFVKIKR